ncbi:MAG: C-GCAxxG-C-C family protein [Bacillota bacterium]|nr:C-GCAxxG-C-C family protein [Bacillota bacterium]
MLEDRLREYYVDKDYNCSETVFLAFSDEYLNGASQKEAALMAGFGLGMGCKRTCGALTGGIAFLGKLLVKDRAHTTPDLSRICCEFVEFYTEKLGSDQCDVLREKHRTDKERCFHTVVLSAQILDEFLRNKGLIKNS